MTVTSRPSTRTWLVGKEVLSVLLIAAGLVAVSTLIQVQLLQIPGYLLILGSDLIQNPLLPGLSGGAYTAFLAVYLYGVAIIVGNLYRWGRSLQAHN